MNWFLNQASFWHLNTYATPISTLKQYVIFLPLSPLLTRLLLFRNSTHVSPRELGIGRSPCLLCLSLDNRILCSLLHPGFCSGASHCDTQPLSDHPDTCFPWLPVHRVLIFYFLFAYLLLVCLPPLNGSSARAGLYLACSRLCPQYLEVCLDSQH